MSTTISVTVSNKVYNELHKLAIAAVQEEARWTSPASIARRLVTEALEARGVVVEPEPLRAAPAESTVQKVDRWRAALEVLPVDGLVAADWQRKTALSKRTFFRMLMWAVDEGLVDRRGGVYRHIPQSDSAATV